MSANSKKKRFKQNYLQLDHPNCYEYNTYICPDLINTIHKFDREHG